MKNIKRILIVMPGGIGNLILLIPFLRALRQRFPDGMITLLTAEPGVENIVKGDGLVDEFISHRERDSRSMIKNIYFFLYMRNRKFDLAIMSTGTNPLKAGLMTYLMGIPVRTGEDINGKGYWYNVKVDYDENMHELDCMSKLIEPLGIDISGQEPLLSVSKENEKFANVYLSNYNVMDSRMLIGIHAGSGIKQRNFKRWPKERFAEICDALAKKYRAKIILTGGKHEAGLINEIAQLMEDEPIKIAGRLTVRQTAAIIKKCTFFISNDSGLAHIAAAVQVPLIVIFGATNFKKIKPRGKDIIVVRKELPCSPCYSRGKVKCEQIDCLNLITVDDVLKAFDKLLADIPERNRFAI